MLRNMIKAGWVLSLFLVIGCAHIPFFGKSSQSTKETVNSSSPETKLESSEYVEKGQIVDKTRLKQSKNIAVIPFTAGVDVEANDELDRIALMIVKGIADTMEDSSYNIVTAENSDIADIVIQGHVTNLKGPSKIKRWVMLKGYKMLGVEGKVVDVKTQEPVAVFSDRLTGSKNDYMDLGHEIGKNIGLFILSGAD